MIPENKKSLSTAASIKYAFNTCLKNILYINPLNMMKLAPCSTDWQQRTTYHPAEDQSKAQ